MRSSHTVNPEVSARRSTNWHWRISLSLVLCLTTFMAGCNKPAVKRDILVSGQVRLVKEGGKGIEPGLVDVQIFTKKVFDAILLQVMNNAETSKRSIPDGILKDREKLEQQLHFRQMEKEQTESAKETVLRMLAPIRDPGVSANFRKEIFSFNDQLGAIDQAMAQDRAALNHIAEVEGEAQGLSPRDLVVRAILNTLPKPFKALETDVDGKFRVLLNGEEEYVVVTNVSC